jgi:type IV secretory pathway TraG/TraD family ATPase VirD4
MPETKKSLQSIDWNNPNALGEALPTLIHDYGSSLLVLAAIGAYFLWDPSGRNGKIRGSAFWAKAAHINRARWLCRLQNISQKPGKISYELGNIPIYGAQTSTITFGAPDTGKSFGILNQKNYKHLQTKQPLVLLDLQYPEQTQHFVPIAAKFGYKPENIRLFVPGEKVSDVWNPIEYAKGSKALEMGISIDNNVKPLDAKSDGFFTPASQSLFAGLMAIARYLDGLDSVLGCRAIARLPDLVKRIDASMDKLMAIDPFATSYFDQFLTNLTSEKTAANIVGTVMNTFSRLVSEDIYPCMYGKSTIPLFMDDTQLLVIGCTQQYRKIVSPILVALLEQVIKVNAVHGRKTNLLISYDEMAGISVPDLPAYLNENRKYGVYFNLGAQTPTQLNKIYTKDGAASILTAVGNKAFFNLRENETALYLEKTLGIEKYRTSELSRGYSNGRSSSNRNRPIREKPLFSTAEVLKMPQGTAVFILRGISSKTEEYIPWKTRVKPDPKYLADMEWSKNEWHSHTKTALERRSPVQPPSKDVLLQTMKLAEDFFPPVEKNDEKTIMDIIAKNNKVYQDMMEDL